jgi:hypothetical protein
MQSPEELVAEQTPRIWYEFRDLVFAKRFDEAGRLLAGEPRLVSMTNGCGESALHFLAIENDLEGVAWLHARGLSVDTVDAFGEPVVFAVAQLGYHELFSWFASVGANLDTKNREGLSLISHLKEYEKQEMADWISARFL